jgi:hypothetical protein
MYGLNQKAINENLKEEQGEQQRSSCQMTKLIGSYAAEWSPFKKAREVEHRLQTRELWKHHRKTLLR